MNTKHILTAIIFAATGLLMSNTCKAAMNDGAVSISGEDTTKKNAVEIKAIDNAITEIDQQISRLKHQLESDNLDTDDEARKDIENTVRQLELARTELVNTKKKLEAGSMEGSPKIVISDDEVRIRFRGKHDTSFNELPNVKTDWFTFNLGVNALLDNGSFNMSPPNKALELDYLWSVNAALNILTQGVNIYKHNVYLTYGIGLSFNDYRLANKDMSILPKTDTFVVVTPSAEFKKVKLSLNYLEAPVMLNFETDPYHPKHSFGISLGGYVNMLYSSYQKQVSDGKKAKIRDDYNLNQFNYGLMAQLGTGSFKVYARYGLTPLFEPNKGPNVTPISFGLVIDGFDWN